MGRKKTVPEFPAENGRKRCSKCKEVLPVSSFKRNAAYTDGYRIKCTDCLEPTVPDFPASNGFKRCLTCDKTKEIAAFAKSNEFSDGLASECRVCRKKRGNTSKFPAVDGIKRCVVCREEKSVEEFLQASHYEDGYFPKCKVCRVVKPKFPAVDGHKTCQECLVNKSVEDFYVNGDYEDGRNPKCKPCMSRYHKARYDDPTTHAKIKRNQVKWRALNPHADANKTLRRRYNITLEDYERINEAQGGVCALCGGREKVRRRKKAEGDERFAVDHCHDTGLIRGLLCFKCNTAIGSLGDTDQIIRRVIDYLSSYVLDPSNRHQDEDFTRKPRTI